MATYTELEARWKAWLEDDSTEADTAFDVALENAEQRISRELSVDAMITHETGTLTASSHELTRPAGTFAIKSFVITVSSAFRHLWFRQVSFINDYWPSRSTTGTPKYYGNLDNDTLIVVPTPDQNYAYEIQCESRVTGLSSGTPTTWISANYPDLLFYACLLEGGVYQQDDARRAAYQAEYDRNLASCRAEVARIRSDSNNIIQG